ncbi:MAG: 2-oxoacid:acceptor oxidoreductase subunit alpha [Gammaproteobacteria bacterium]|nr:2-oxoacid:acceptor oxidoreductase subunit alpha [Gammaproteobacteria bacterium]
MNSPSENDTPKPTSFSIALVGSGGSGVMTAGSLLLEAAGRAGLYGIMTRASGPQIRGGEGAALLRLSTSPVFCHSGHFDLLLAIDWLNADRFAGEIPLDEISYLAGDDKIPDYFVQTGASIRDISFKQLSTQAPGLRPNMIALGLIGAAIGLPQKELEAVSTKLISKKGEDAVQASLAGLSLGAANASLLDGIIQIGKNLEPRSEDSPELWNISGNEAAGLGAIRGGIRFVAAYPITPATEVLEWLAPSLEKIGGVLVQAEDELASVNQLIGASFGGTPSLTATSGPGLALMTESIGLAVASETPIVVVNVMRGGPSTGIPTKSEQSDLNIAIYGLHGDAPHLVVAPLSVGDCLFTTQWAVHLAETLQTAAIVLSDQSMGQARSVIPQPANISFPTKRLIQSEAVENYQRYKTGGSGVSAMALPGLAGCQYTADGLEHNPKGTPSSRAEDHAQQLDKRHNKLIQHDYGEHWAQIEGEGEIAVITWGSSLAPVQEALHTLAKEGIKIRLIAPRLLLPVQPEHMAAALAGVETALVVEQSHGAQFFHYLRAFYAPQCELQSMAMPGAVPIRPDDVLKTIKKLRGQK